MGNEKVTVSALIVQVLATLIIASLVCLSAFVSAWPSYTLENFRSNETVLSYPMSRVEISILVSLTHIGALIATPFCGYAVNTFGRKYSAMMFGIPYILAWLIISFTSYVPLVIAAIGLAGFGSAGQVVSSIYICEIAQDSIRGGLASTVVSGYYLGLLFSYFLGGRLIYHQVVYIHLLLSMVYVALLLLLKESPVFLVQQGNLEEAARSIAFYRQIEATSKEVEIVIYKIKLQLSTANTREYNRIYKGESVSDVTDELIVNKLHPKVQPLQSPWTFLKHSESTKRALATVLILMSANILMGAIVLHVYVEPMFKESMPSMPPNLCPMFLAVDLMVASLICASLVDRFGRKFLMTFTSAAAGTFTALLGVQLQLHFGPHWFTAFLVYGFCFVYNLGCATVPFILAVEVFLPEVRGLCNSITMAVMWTTNFVTLMVFNPLVEILGLGPLVCCSSAVCFLTAVYSWLCLPETKGLAADAIQPLFVKRRRVRDDNDM